MPQVIKILFLPNSDKKVRIEGPCRCGAVVERASLMREVAGSILAQVWWLLSVIRVGPYKRVSGSRTLEHTLQMLLLMGRQVVRSRLTVILDIKELATPSFSGQFT